MFGGNFSCFRLITNERLGVTNRWHRLFLLLTFDAELRQEYRRQNLGCGPELFYIFQHSSRTSQYSSVSGLRCFISPHFYRFSLAEADDAYTFSCVRETQYVQSVIEIPQGHPSDLTIISPRIDGRDRRLKIKIGCPIKR
jgi:hypothetical protein